MKENVSFLKLAIRSSFYKFLLLTALVCLIQAVMFAAYANSGRGLESALNAAPIIAAAFIAFVAAVILLMLPWQRLGRGNPAATLNRLRITNVRAAMWLAVYNSLCFLIFWAAQLALFLLLCKGYLVITGASGHLHLICLAAWRVNYFHMLLPLQDAPGLVRNFLIIISMAITAVALGMEASAVSLALTLSALISAATDGAGSAAGSCFIDIGILAAVILCEILIIKRACKNKEEPIQKERKKRKRSEGERGRKRFSA